MIASKKEWLDNAWGDQDAGARRPSFAIVLSEHGLLDMASTYDAACGSLLSKGGRMLLNGQMARAAIVKAAHSF